MRWTTKLSAGLALSAAFLAAGCGAGVSVPGASSVAPKNAAAYLSVDANLGSVQWKRAMALLGRFPGATQLRQQLDQIRAVRAAFGDRVDLVWIDFANGGRNVVAITKPRDPEALRSLLRNSSNPPVSTQIDGWTVIAQDQATLSAFQQQRDQAGSGLDDDSAFKNAFEDLPQDALVQGFLRGSKLQAAIARAVKQATAPPGFNVIPYATGGSLESVGAAVIPQSGGVRLEATATGDFESNPTKFHPELPAELPSGALAYLSFSNLEDSLRNALDSIGQFVPNFDQVRAQLEARVGVSLDKDVLPLFGGEGALAVYPGQPLPRVDFVLKVDDEAAAHRVIDRLTALGEQTGQGRVSPTTIAGLQATQVVLSKDVSLFVTVFAGKIVVTNSGATLEAIRGGGSKLADDPVYKAAVAGADLPRESAGFVYANLQDGLPYAFKLAERQQGQAVRPEVRANTEPLRGLLLWTSKQGDHFDLTGFVGIK